MSSVSTERLNDWQAEINAFDQKYGAHVIGTEYEKGNCDTLHEQLAETRIEVLREVLIALRTSKAREVPTADRVYEDIDDPNKTGLASLMASPAPAAMAVTDEIVAVAQNAYANSGPDKYTRMRAALYAALEVSK